MTTKRKEKLEGLRKENAVKNMYYTRYLLIRYVVAFYFFVNLYWTLVLTMSEAYSAMVLPIVLMVFAALAIWEQTRMYSKEQRSPRVTIGFFRVSVIANLSIIGLVVFQQSAHLFPFFNVNLSSSLVLIGIQLVGLLLSSWMLLKLHRINRNIDKHYYRIRQYLSAIKH